MKYSMIAILCAAQLLHAPMAFAVGESADIAKYSRYNDLTVYGQYTFYTPEIRRLYALRGNSSVWFVNNRSNGKMQSLISALQNDPNLSGDIADTWIPVLRRLNQGMTKDTWISVEMVASYIMLIYLTDNNITDYRALNRALGGSPNDLYNYLSSVPNGGGSIINFGGDDVNQPSVVTIPTVTTNPWPPVVQQQPVNTTFQVAPEVIGTSVAHYANDPGDDDVNQLYSFYTQSIWVDGSGNANDMAASLKDILRSANRHGLNPNDYWDTNLETMYQNVASYGNRFEWAATKSFLRYVNHLSGGRLDPKNVDSKLLKFDLKKFTDMQLLTMLLEGGAGQLKASLDMLAPQLPQYQQLMSNLARLSSIKQQGTWKKIGAPATPLKIGSSGTIVSSLRTQLAQLGYQNTGAGNVYDNDLDQAVKVYIDKNGLQKMDYRFWNSLYKTVDERILQVSVNMEKLRWVPANAAARYAFVNLAAQEIRLMDQGQVIMKFRTVNGMAERPTPSMLQQAKQVLLNPTWTTPMSLALKDKIPAIQQDPTYMTKHNMYILDTRTGKYLTDPMTGQPVTDLSSVDMSGFTNDTSTNRYYFVQGPGNQNALGVLKFPLRNMDGTLNPDDIYMHDTNERGLFTETMRYRSSGCIRLQYPLEFAAELLKGAPKALTVDDIKAKTPWDNPDQEVTPEQTNQSFSLAKPLIVYIIYLTSEQNEDGSVRLFEDTYGIDAKIVEALKASI